MPVLNENNEVYGIITENQITNRLTSFKINVESTIASSVIKDFKQVKTSDSIKYLSKGFTRHTYILVSDNSKHYFVSESKDLLRAFLNKD